MKKGFIGFVLLCQLLLTTIVAQLPAPKIGDVAPELNFAKTLQSNPGVANLNSLKGSVVVLEFWATWCGPCIPALKHFNQLSGKFISKPVRFIAITDEDEAVVARFMKTVPITTWIGLDNNGATFGAYRANQRPYTVVIDRGGRIAAITNPEAVTETVLNDLLADKKVDLPAKTVVPDDLEWDLAETPDGIKPLAQIIIKPSYSTFAGIMRESGHISSDGAYLQSLISVAYQISPVRTIYNLPESKNTYRVSAIAPPGREDSLFPLFQQFLVATFGLDIKREVRERDVLLLTMPKDKAAILQPSRSPKSFGMTARGKMTYKKHKIKVLADQLEGVLNLPVIDQTGLVGEFDWELIYNHADNNVLLNGVREKLGIEVTATKMQIEVLVVGKQSLPR